MDVFLRRHIILTILDNIIINATCTHDVTKLRSIIYFRNYIPIGFMSSDWEIDESLVSACIAMFDNTWKNIIKQSGFVGHVHIYMIKNKNKFEIICKDQCIIVPKSEQYFGPYILSTSYCPKCNSIEEFMRYEIQSRSGDEYSKIISRCQKCFSSFLKDIL